MGQKDIYVSSVGQPGQEEMQIAAVRQQSRYSTRSPALAWWEGDGEIHPTAPSLLPHPFTATLSVLGRAQQLPTTFLRAQRSLLDFSY